MGIIGKKISVENKSLWKKQKAEDAILRPAYSSKKDPASKAKTLTILNKICRNYVRMDGWVQADVLIP